MGGEGGREAEGEGEGEGPCNPCEQLMGSSHDNIPERAVEEKGKGGRLEYGDTTKDVAESPEKGVRGGEGQQAGHEHVDLVLGGIDFRRHDGLVCEGCDLGCEPGPMDPATRVSPAAAMKRAAYVGPLARPLVRGPLQSDARARARMRGFRRLDPA